MKNYTPETIASLLPFPAEDAHKYSRGKLTLIAGSMRFPGAAMLASSASQRAGAGYSEAYVADEVVALIQTSLPSLVVRPWSAFNMDDERPSSPEHPLAYLVGCGFDEEDPLERTITRRILKKAAAPVLIDGGGLRLICDKKLRQLCRRRADKGWPTVITPHGGEAAGLAKAAGIAGSDPAALAVELSRAYGAVTVLKGPDTYISDGQGVYRMTQGTSALAKAGTGDVLAGVLGAFLAQGMDAFDASVAATTLHAIAGNMAAVELSPLSVRAEDVVHYLPKAVLEMEDAYLNGAE